ncbi:Sirt3 protein [Salpingoeca rosetta]|uniref:NAD-dependent protein deacetylase n=1 Tax=Salpingoeca rosetta (strain ATCC 50818 / BSB-021) TaxID=946362 RepID=F2UI01_SALR5|nr:Sirt3 protein [Salpingoeca rosetta]EGD76750.1 Sirt3 protein [Salpingoeca rosetta]|eukprot:XP_004991122.1 Sirt3 protein [Salpingoeca rosetta]
MEGVEGDGDLDLLADLIGHFGQVRVEEPQPEREPVLSSFDAEGFVKYLLDNNCKKVVVMAGAGISTSAGIPDFRSPGTGLYDNLQKYELEEPEDVFSIDFFRENPNPFYDLAKELYPGHFKPTPSHHFVRLLQDKGILLRHYTQNIDTLERMAGVADDKVIEAHGSFATAHCTDCQEEADPAWVKGRVFAGDIPHCQRCGGVVKPDIVFFGESLPERFTRGFRKDLADADALIVMGTSLKVHPFASLISYARKDVPRILINRDRVGEDGFAFYGSAFDFDAEYRDVFMGGTCDDGVRVLARLLGWEEDLDRLVADGNTAFETERQRHGGTDGDNTTEQQNGREGDDDDDDDDGDGEDEGDEGARSTEENDKGDENGGDGDGDSAAPAADDNGAVTEKQES